MKKALFFLFSVVLLCSCRGPKGDPGEGMNWKIVDLKVTQWDYSGYAPYKYQDNNYYYAKFDVPALTSFVFTDGNVNGYIILHEGNEQIQHSLPYVLHIATKDSEGNPYYYTETVDFVYGIGWVQIEVRDSDFAYEGDPVGFAPGVMDFRIVMTY